MILALSTSCPWVSVALLRFDGALIAGLEREAAGAASGAIAEMTTSLLTSTGTTLNDLTVIAVDVGPGGFTGTRVGVTFAKTLAWARSLELITASSFDLVNPHATVALPSRKGEWYVREPGSPPKIMVADTSQTGKVFEAGLRPSAYRFGPLIAGAKSIDPVSVVPEYVAPPSISQPKKPFVRGPL